MAVAVEQKKRYITWWFRNNGDIGSCDKDGVGPEVLEEVVVVMEMVLTVVVNGERPFSPLLHRISSSSTSLYLPLYLSINLSICISSWLGFSIKILFQTKLKLKTESIFSPSASADERK